MVSIPKIVGVMSCSFLLCLGLSNAARADNTLSAVDEMKADQSDRRQGGQEAGEKQITDKMRVGQSQAGKTIKGEVLRVEGDNWFVKGEDGKEVRLHIDQTTQRSPKTGDIEEIKQGSHIEATVNDQNHAVAIRSSDRRDDRHDHSSNTNAEEPPR
jgi:hypothetical protein